MGVKVRERPKGSGVWWIFIDHQGKRKAKRVGKDRKLALEVAKKIEVKMFLAAEETTPSQDECPTFKKYAAMWLSTYATYSLKSSTRKAYECNLNPWMGKRQSDGGAFEIHFAAG
jgi:integrase